MNRAIVIASLLLSGTVGMCTMGRLNHARELHEMEMRYAPPPQAKTTRETARQKAERERLQALWSMRDPNTTVKVHEEREDRIWDGIDIVNVPRERFLEYVNIADDEKTETEDQSCLCIGGIKGGGLPPPPGTILRSTTDIVLKTHGPWKRISVVRGYSNKWVAIFNTGPVNEPQATEITEGITAELRSRFGLDRRSRMIRSRWDDHDMSMAVQFSRPGSTDGHVQSAAIESIGILRSSKGVLLGITLRDGIGGDSALGRDTTFDDAETSKRGTHSGL